MDKVSLEQEENEDPAQRKLKKMEKLYLKRLQAQGNSPGQNKQGSRQGNHEASPQRDG